MGLLAGFGLSIFLVIRGCMGALFTNNTIHAIVLYGIKLLKLITL